MAVTVTVVTKIKISLDIQKSPTYPITTPVIIALILALICLVLSGFFSGSEAVSYTHLYPLKTHTSISVE